MHLMSKLSPVGHIHGTRVRIMSRLEHRLDLPVTSDGLRTVNLGNNRTLRPMHLPSAPGALQEVSSRPTRLGGGRGWSCKYPNPRNADWLQHGSTP